MNTNVKSPETPWQTNWPRKVVAVVAVVQLLMTIGVITTELISVLIDYIRGTAYAGFYCSLFFTGAWISTFIVVCCKADSMPCAIHTLVQNILSLCAAVVVIYFDSVFISNPYTCVFATGSSCSSGASALSSSSLSYSTKQILFPIQLAFAAVILITNIIYIIIFIVVMVRVSKAAKEGSQPMMYDNRKAERVQAIPMGGKTNSAATRDPNNKGVKYHPTAAGPSPPFLVQCPHCRTLIYAV